jgi:2-oxoglutarate ferredoxin oxidoreductase subunit beta
MNIALQTQPPALSEYYSETKCIWCDGCGNYGICTAVKYALVELNLHRWQVCLSYNVGCHGNGSDKIEGYRFHGLHGRVIPFAAGAKLAKMKVPVIAFGGDGATFSEGIGHLIHGVRSNYPITFVLHKNTNYGLTTGQASSTREQGRAIRISIWSVRVAWRFQLDNSGARVPPRTRHGARQLDVRTHFCISQVYPYCHRPTSAHRTR